MTLYRVQLREAAAALLLNQTDAVTRVYHPDDRPKSIKLLPAILIQMPRETKNSVGKNGPPSFDVTATMEIVGWVAGTGATATEAAIDGLVEQIENTLLCSPSFTAMVSQVVSIESSTLLTAEANYHLGECTILLGLEFLQLFEPIIPTALGEIQVNVDLVNVFDAAGTYVDPPFPEQVTPAPRTAGPDGRNEGALDITLPQ